MSDLEINLISLLAGFGIGAILGEFVDFAKRLFGRYPNEAFCLIPIIALIISIISYCILVNNHTVAFSALGAGLFHMALFARRKCLAGASE